MLPARPHLHQSAADFFGRDFSVRSGENSRCFALGSFQQLGVADDVRYPEARQSCLPRAEKLPGPAKFEIKLRNLKAIIRADHSVQASLSFFRDFTSSHQDAIRLGRT